jgi:hypothetical protein
MEMLDAITAALKRPAFSTSRSIAGLSLRLDECDFARRSAGAARRIATSLESHCDENWLFGVFFRHQRRYAAGRSGGCGRFLLTALADGGRARRRRAPGMRKVSRGGLAATKVDVITPEQIGASQDAA